MMFHSKNNNNKIGFGWPLAIHKEDSKAPWSYVSNSKRGSRRHLN
jgi:hypothetical protein